MVLIEKYPKYTFALVNVSIVVWWALLAVPRFTARQNLLVLGCSLVGMNFALWLATRIVKRRRRGH
jgi:hypothetical protein